MLSKLRVNWIRNERTANMTQPMRSHQNTAGTRFVEYAMMIDNFKKYNHPTMENAKQLCFTDTIQFNTEGHLLCIFQFDRQTI